MYIFFYLLLLMVSFIYKKNRYYDLIVFIFTIVIVYMHPYCADYENYENVYNYIASGLIYYDTGIGWYYICSCFIQLGIIFRLFKTIICAISLILINSTIKYYINKENSKYFWALYLIFPLLIQCIQFRDFFATSLVIFALKFMPKRSIKNMLVSFLILVCAILVHSSLYYVLAVYLILLNKLLRNNTKKVTCILLLIMTFLLFSGQEILLNVVSKFINNVRIERYFTVSNKPTKFVVFLVNIFAIVLNYIPLNNVIKNKNFKKFNDKNKYLVLFANRLSILSFLLIPLLFFDNNFIRILEVSIIATNIATLVAYENSIQYIDMLKIKTYDLLLLNSVIYFMIFIPKKNVFLSMLM